MKRQIEVNNTMNAKTNSLEQSTSSSLSLAGKRVVVVGGKTGIGLGIARAAHVAGASVIVASRRVTPVAQHPELAHFEQVTLDITDEDAVRTAFDRIGPFDHLVVTSGPGFGTWGTFMADDMRGVRSYMDAKFMGSWACARYAAPHLRADGSVTFLTGGTAARPKLGLTAVVAAFAAVESLSGSLALEMAPIRVNTIRPGYIDTELWNVLSEDQRVALKERVRTTFPARHAGTTENVGHAALFLMTNPYVSGTVIEVSGGENLVPSVF
jgi:NAD(P)-dependent dehydrogenase (short-subunit alcohol dehydrogenase family)